MKVRYYGHIGARTGYGVAARAMCRALLTADIDLEIRPLDARTPLDDLAGDLPLAPCLRRDDELSIPDFIIAHTLPRDCVKIVGAHAPLDARLEDVPWVAYTTWEARSLIPPGVAEDLSIFDQVWTPSSYSQEHLATSYSTFAGARCPRIGMHAEDMTGPPVYVVPHAYDAAQQRPARGPSLVVRPYRFLYVGAWSSRKNPAGLMRAFAHAGFARGEAELEIHSPGTARETFAVAHAQTGCHTDMAAVRLSNGALSEVQMAQMYRDADCFVTASRGEAWNLPAFEAMLHGVHAICPTPAGSDEFLSRTSANLVAAGQLAPAGVDVVMHGTLDDGSIDMDIIGAQGLSARSLWWDPDLCELADVMRECVAQKRRVLSLGYDPAERFSYETVGKLALQHLEQL